MRTSLFHFFVMLILTLPFIACASPYKNEVPDHLPKAIKLIHPPRVALVLGAGGIHGYAHIGVLKVLQQSGVPIDLIAAASAGSIIGALYADTKDANYVNQVMQKAGFWDFADIASPTIKGFISGKQFRHFLADHMQARDFSQLKIKLILATSDLKTGAAYAIASGPIIPAIVASATVPIMLQPVSLYGKTLVDGGITDSVPVDLAKRYHPKIIIAVNVTGQLPKSMPKTAVGIYKRAQLILYQNISYLSERGANIVIRPQVGAGSAFRFKGKEEMVALGRRAAEQALPQILHLLTSNNIPLLQNKTTQIKYQS